MSIKIKVIIFPAGLFKTLILNRTGFFHYFTSIITVIIVVFTSCVKDSNLNVLSDTITIAKIFHPNALYGKDATIESITPNQNFGNSPHSAIFSWTNGGSFNTSRAFIQFDLSDIVPQTKITSAKLSFFWVSSGEVRNSTGQFFECLS